VYGLGEPGLSSEISALRRRSMEMTRRQFALTLAAASYLRLSLFEPLSPLGVGRGVIPGRVTWAHDPAAVTWDGTGSWWTDVNNNQSVIDRMVSRSICALTIKKATPSMELHFSLLQPHSWSRRRWIQSWREDRHQGESEQHNRPRHDRTTELVASFAALACPAADRPSSNAAVINHGLRFQSLGTRQSL
jgi:hypothetical protein